MMSCVLRNSGLSSIKFLCATLSHMSIRTRVVVAVAFQEVDNTPDTETCTERNNEGLKNINSRVKKFHRLNVAERKSCKRTDHRTYRSALLSKILILFDF